MKTTGIILLIIGSLSLFGGIMSPSGSMPLTYLFKFALIGGGIMMINSANKKKPTKTTRKSPVIPTSSKPKVDKPVMKPKMSDSGMLYMEGIQEEELSFDQLVQNAMGRLMTGNPRKGLEEINQALRIKSNDADAYHIRGSLKKDLGDMKGACEDWHKSNELGGDARQLISENCH
jgi:hypothetical protein